MMDLMAAMLAAVSSLEYGLSVLARSSSPPTGAALRTVTTALDLGATWDVAWDIALPSNTGAIAPLGQALRFAGTTGAPSAAVVTAYAAQFRRRRNRQAEKRAAALGVRLVVPLGLCSLPAFVCLGVIPILVGLFPTFG
ncbi:type II secretion system F family protein [Arthrobacter sp. JZ12]|uniref:type II secretion system F family protein n=1 Tax=Arthrobacter sp. JZ12 TaxID=2654190 RepID=UPI002B48A6E3|nr:type II secretion system F family protein [Arthrobacter sp. JZ12]